MLGDGERARRKFPTNPEVLDAKGRGADRIRRQEGAIATYKRMNEIAPNSAAGPVALSCAAQRDEGLFPSARRLEAAIARDPKKAS